MLDEALKRYNVSEFIEHDPISIPHKFTLKQDIEISAFWTAILSWGQRVTIINKANDLFERMDGAPYDFIKNHEESDRKKLLSFKHRTFQSLDTLYFLEFLQYHYRQSDSLENAFWQHKEDSNNVEQGLNHFRAYFFSLPVAPERTRKHIASPQRKSTCKRLNMFLRWMIRKDNQGVDFGLWNAIDSSRLMIPFDVHVARVSREMGLLSRKQNDWKAVVELTNKLKEFDADDPVKYDYALFGLGVGV